MKALRIIVLLALGLVASVALLVGVGLYLNERAAAAATAFCSKVSPGMPEPEALAAGAASGALHFPGTNEHRFRFQGWVFNAAVCRVTTADGRVVRAVVEETGD